MPRFHVITTFDDLERAREAMNHLHEQAFSADHVGLLTSERGHALVRRARTLPETRLRDDPEEGVATGGLAGAVLGGLSGLALAGPPGLVAGGMLAGVAAGVIAGGAVGSLVGLLADMGMPEDEARELEERLQRGALLLTVLTTEPSRASTAAHTLRGHSDAPVGTFEVPEPVDPGLRAAVPTPAQRAHSPRT